MDGETADSSQGGWLAGFKNLVHAGIEGVKEAAKKEAGALAEEAPALKNVARGAEGETGAVTAGLGGALVGAGIGLVVDGATNVSKYLKGEESGGQAIAKTVEGTIVGGISGFAAGVGGLVGGAAGLFVGGEVGEVVGAAAGGIGTGMLADAAMDKVEETPAVEGAVDKVAHGLDSAWDAAKGLLGSSGGPADGGGGTGSPPESGGGGGAPAPSADGSGGGGGAPAATAAGDSGGGSPPQPTGADDEE